ncbi:MAG: MFS transporter [Lachnospiraceae bacterium]
MNKLIKNKSFNVFTTYLIAVSFIALAFGFSDSILSNYYDNVYNATTAQRGFIEFPRELPGVLALFVIALLAKLGDFKIAVIAQFISMIGIMILAFYTPSFYTMTGVLFIFSMGQHIYLPLQDSLALSLYSRKDSGNLGANIGNVKAVYTVFSLIASFLIFIGFRLGFFSFMTPIKWVFVISGLCFFIAFLFLSSLHKQLPKGASNRPKLVVRKEYAYYYILAVMNGVQKQIVIVYSPWVIIKILGQGADTLSLLLMISSLCGIFFLPFLGRCLDRFGIRKMLYADAISFIIVYLAFAYMTYNIYVGNFQSVGIAALGLFALYIIDRMSSQMGFIRSVYLNSIVIDKSEVVSTLSLGISLDHVVAILCSLVSGLIWETYGPHYIFILAASFSLVNLVIAKIVPLKDGV